MDSANAASVASQKNKSGLGPRVLSAVLLLPLVILLIWWNYAAVAITVGALSMVGVLELYAAFRAGGYLPRRTVGVSATLLMVIGLAASQSSFGFELLGPALTIAIIGTMVYDLRRHREPAALASWALTLAGALYVGWLFAHYILLRGISTPGLRPAPLGALAIEPGAAWIYAVLTITFLQDTFAYFAGRLFGRHRMAPELSPKKTWEGFAGGMGGAIAGACIATYLLGLPISYLAAAVLGIVGGIIGPLGDLAESSIKRQVGIKDAGRLIPGHGGLLDRIDSVLFTGPVLYYLIQLFLRIGF